MVIESEQCRDMSSYGINPQASLMFPCDRELGQTLALGHGGGVLTVKAKCDPCQQHNMRMMVNMGDNQSNRIENGGGNA